MSKRFAAFIMTYERQVILLDTINKILSQSLAPEKILVVDNSNSYATQELIDQLNDSRVQYYRVGFNGGPATAAKIGLKLLADEGFTWIYWADDDNPPQYDSILSELVNEGEYLLRQGIKVGAIGISGSLFNRFTGLLEKIKSDNLQKTNEVLTIPGNAKFIIHSQVVREGVFPMPELFFGFEEMDFALQMRKKGFRLFCHGPLLLEHRRIFNRLEKRSYDLRLQNQNQLNRRYYSIRNLIFILVFRQGWYWSAMMVSLRAFGRVVIDLRYGFSYFLRSFSVFSVAFRHALSKRLGYYSPLVK